MLENLNREEPPPGEGEDYMDERTVGRRGTDGGGDNTMPWQVKAIGVVGVPSAIALYLVFSIVSAQQRDGGSLMNTINSHAGAAAVHATESKEQGLRLERYLQLICVNTAKSDLDRTNCFGR